MLNSTHKCLKKTDYFIGIKPLYMKTKGTISIMTFQLNFSLLLKFLFKDKICCNYLDIVV